MYLISLYALKNQLAAISSPPVAEEKRVHSGDGRELSEDSIWARSWKRRIQPRVGLKAVEPVLYSTPMTGEKSALIQYPCLTPTTKQPVIHANRPRFMENMKPRMGQATEDLLEMIRPLFLTVNFYSLCLAIASIRSLINGILL